VADVEEASHLREVVAITVLEDDDGSLAWRQSLDQLTQLQAGGGGRRTWRREHRHDSLQLSAPTLNPKAGPDADAGQPGLDGGRVAELVSMSPRSEIRVVDDVLGAGMADERDGDPDEARSRGCERSLEIDGRLGPGGPGAGFDRRHLFPFDARPGRDSDHCPIEPRRRRSVTRFVADTDVSRQRIAAERPILGRVSPSDPLWQRRYRAPVVGFPTWSRQAPDRLAYISSESGVYQLHSWDLATGERRQVSEEPVGLINGTLTADGEWLVWHRDITGDESGVYVAAPFSGGRAERFVEGLPVAWDQGLAIGRHRTLAAISDREGFAIFASEAGGPARLLLRSPDSIELGGANAMVRGGVELAALSADERLACLEHAEHGDLIHQALRIIDATTGQTIADLRDDGLCLDASAWSPVVGDPRLAIAHERHGERQPAIWDTSTGEVTDIPLPWDRLTEVADWWPDGSAVLLAELRDGRHRLHRFDFADQRLTELPVEPGSMTGARIRPDGAVWYRLQRGDQPGALLEVGRTEPLLAPPDPPPGRPFIPWEFSNPHGQRVQGWRVEPDPGPAGSAPWPTLMLIHGGPTSIDLDRWAPDIQAYVDAGFQVAMLNYRGSIGFGAAWRDALIRNIGWPEIEDILAGLDDLVANGWTDAKRAVIAGWSWGGYLTLLMHGMHPERFVTGVAGVPVGDYAAGYEDLSPLLQAYDRALLGAAPADVPELMAERSPISYVDRVTAPILFLAGEHDSRCPIRQVLLYTDRLAARSHPHELYLFPTGHAPFQIEERIKQTGVVLDFLARQVPGIRRLEGIAKGNASESGARDPMAGAAASA
jgi:dienelactone hydrolase